jgi:hypothetical protein
VHRSIAVIVALLLVAGLGSAAAVGGKQAASTAPPIHARTDAANQAPVDAAGAPAPVPEAVATTVAPPPVPHPTGPVPLAGCPPPPAPTGPPSTPWHPAVLVPEAALPAPAPPEERNVRLAALAGKGMWVWKFKSTENGNADAIVTKAAAAGLRQLWVRVGDSQDGFYAASVLDQLVPKAQAQGIAVIGWGFPYLYDPQFDAHWTADVLAWRGPNGERLDGFSPDLETASEGVMVTERRLQVYLGQVAPLSAERPLIATVFRPTDRLWASYPYGAIAPYVDSFAPMVYWGCTEPGAAATQAMARLAALRPVHLVGQGYNMADDGGRRVSPSADETWRFLDVAHGGGALGASFWDWQEISQEQWTAMAEFTWPVYTHSIERQ